jgi:enoyl-CoA hydratase
MPELHGLEVSVADRVARIVLNRPRKANALDGPTWAALGEAFRWADAEPGVRAVVLHGAGPHFCAGIDFGLIAELSGEAFALPDGPRQELLRRRIVELQSGLSEAERCRKPVIAALHGSCFGGAIDLATACDIRVASADARLCVKEVDLAIVADVGTLQRLPRIVGEGVARELALTARVVEAEEARELRLVNRVLPDREAAIEAALELARTIASKSPIAIRGTKQVMNYSRDHGVADGLEYVATWNAGLLLSRDAQAAFAALLEKRSPEYED